jgi:hypothetical protein
MLEQENEFDLYASTCEDDPKFGEFRCEDLTANQDVFNQKYTIESLLLFIDESNGEVHFIYGNDSERYHYQLLHEVGESFRPVYEAKLDELDYTTDCKELESYPWMVEYIPNYKPQE